MFLLYILNQCLFWKQPYIKANSLFFKNHFYNNYSIIILSFFKKSKNKKIKKNVYIKNIYLYMSNSDNVILNFKGFSYEYDEENEKFIMH